MEGNGIGPLSPVVVVSSEALGGQIPGEGERQQPQPHQAIPTGD